MQEKRLCLALNTSIMDNVKIIGVIILCVRFKKSLTITAVGQADETVVLSNDLQRLKLILGLVLDYYTKFNVTLSTFKTKLAQILPPGHHKFIPYNPISIKDTTINFVTEAEHG